MFRLDEYLKGRQEVIDRELDARMPAAGRRPAILHEAMRYSVFSGGKRVRPILCLAACEAVGGRMENALVPACAIELLHTYTLIHDDLPAMDDDDLRRGKPTSHAKFGEANAILAGDALLTLTFEWLVDYPQLARELAQAVGSTGTIGGQVEDLAPRKTLDKRQ
ncbi:MAG: polyprenyl synthetase family protein, partial [Patescibacteria group bacterium]